MFKKYDKIINDYKEKDILKELSIAQNLTGIDYKNEKWVALEKIHGANFSVWIYPNEIKYAKRTDFLKENENFYDWKNAIKPFIDTFKTIQKEIDYITIVLYGELYGKGIQKEINYRDNQSLIFYDILIIDNKEEIIKYINWKDAKEFYNRFNLPIVPEVSVDKLNNLLNLNVSIPSLINPIENNIMEGVVIKLYDKETPIGKNGKRLLVFKRKNEKFVEKSKRHPKTKNIIELTEKEKEFLTYFNDNRANAVISKYGKSDKRDGKEIFILANRLVADAWEEFDSDNNFTKGQRKKINKKLNVINISKELIIKNI